MTLCERDVWGGEVVQTIADEVRDAFHSRERLGWDVEIERRFRRRLAQRFADDAVLGEEVEDENAPPWDGHGWIIDPIDGTTNFVQGIPIFGVSVARVEEGQLVAGWIADPLRGVTWCAYRGQGIERRGGEAVSAPPGDLVLMSRRWRERYPDHAVRAASELGLKDRSLGSVSLELALVADGAAVAGAWSRAHVWDIAAGVLLVREAGLAVRDLGTEEPCFGGDPSTLRQRRYDLVGGDPEIVPRLCNLIQ